MFLSARQAEIIRSNQKDDFYIGYIRSSLADIIQSFFGPRTWLRWRQELVLLADLGYLGLTTFAGFQSLGEEYVNIVQVDGSFRTIPTRLRRGFMILLQVAAPYVLDKLLAKLEKYLRLNTTSELTPEAREGILNAIPVIRHTITILHRCHLALFYMKGTFYHIAKRITGTHYALVRDTGDKGNPPSYSILGWLFIIQLTFSLLRQLFKWLQKQKKPTVGTDTARIASDHVSQRRGNKVVQVSEASTDTTLKCVLCLENRTNTTTTPCGHLFCWNCITEWCSSKPECPLCRESFEMSRLICLQNYDPP